MQDLRRTPALGQTSSGSNSHIYSTSVNHEETGQWATQGSQPATSGSVQSGPPCTDKGQAASGGSPQCFSSAGTQTPDFKIVVGKGTRSYGSLVLKDVVERLLQERSLPVRVDPNNDGRLIVAGTDLTAFVELQRQDQRRSRYMQIARWQYALVLAGVSALLSATYIIPLTLKHAT